MQVFEFHADSSVSLATTAAISRKSCDHCFLNRKTCDKVRTAEDSGEKCKRCAKDDRPCTFTPTVHLYHIADCVGRHQCRAKVIQAMGGRKKEVKFKTIEIPIVCDMDSELDLALYEYIQKQPNLLVYNNRIKSFLAHDMLGLSEEEEDRMSSTQTDQGVPECSSESPSHGSKRSFEPDDGSSSDVTGTSVASPTQGPHKYRIMALIDAHQNQTQQQQPPQVQQPPNPISTMTMSLMPTSPTTLSPNSAMLTPQQRLSETLSAAPLTLNTNLAQFAAGYSSQAHPYAQQQPYPQASMVHSLHGYRSNSPIPHSPLAHSPTPHSPQPPSPLELSLNVNTNFGALSGSHHNLPTLFDTNLTMGAQLDQQAPRRVSVGTSTSPQMGMDGTIPNPSPPLVITTTNEDGNEVGVYYAIPSVTLNPGVTDADLFQDFTMMDPLGEDFVWIENLFDEPTLEEAAANMNAMSVAAASGVASTSVDPTLMDGSDTSGLMLNDVAMGSVAFGQAIDPTGLQQQQQQQWANQTFPQTMQG